MNLMKMALNFVTDEQINGIEAAICKEITKLKAETPLIEQEEELLGIIREKDGKIQIHLVTFTELNSVGRILKTIEFSQILELVKKMK